MPRGIWRHGRVKTFLTRGIVGPLFRSSLYTQEELIHYSFTGALNELVVKLDESTPAVPLHVLFWLTLVRLFRLLLQVEVRGRPDNLDGDWCYRTYPANRTIGASRIRRPGRASGLG